MFFVAESITEDPAEFRTAIARFVAALKPAPRSQPPSWRARTGTR